MYMQRKIQLLMIILYGSPCIHILGLFTHPVCKISNICSVEYRITRIDFVYFFSFFFLLCQLNVFFACRSCQKGWMTLFILLNTKVNFEKQKLHKISCLVLKSSSLSALGNKSCLYYLYSSVSNVTLIWRLFRIFRSLLATS